MGLMAPVATLVLHGVYGALLNRSLPGPGIVSHART
jgi:hypothetical protein